MTQRACFCRPARLAILAGLVLSWGVIALPNFAAHADEPTTTYTSTPTSTLPTPTPDNKLIHTDYHLHCNIQRNSYPHTYPCSANSDKKTRYPHTNHYINTNINRDIYPLLYPHANPNWHSPTPNHHHTTATYTVPSSVDSDQRDRLGRDPGQFLRRMDRTIQSRS